ncbi:MAG TPA: S8 family serine peptidase [Actinomycetota bacterium]|nr:S8 family serine peptidase [Actinomycetota bacterium]
MRRVLVSVLALSLVVPSAAAAAAPRSDDTASGRARLADVDGDRLDDVLERRLRRAARGSRHAVVVATDGSLTLAGARRSAGPFSVSRTLRIVHGFAARLTDGQIRTLASTPGVVRIDHDAKVRITMDASRSDYGVQAARSTFGLTGAGVNVCVLDTGVDPAHEQLDSKSIEWSDFIDGSATPYDDHGHGTHVASIAVGDGVGGSLAARFGGVAPAAGLFAGKVLDAEGSGDESGIVAGMEWCAADPDVDIISLSLGTLLPSDGSDVLSLAANAAVADGKIVVVAAGNSGDAPDTIGAPGAAADAITVGAASEWSAAHAAANHSDGIFLAYFSSRGGETFAGDTKPDIVAPGVTIRAADANTASGYIVHSGTSMATPFAAGSIALALQAAPGWSSDQVQDALEATAEDFGPPGKDQDWGAGLLDVLALTAEAEGLAGATSFPRHVHVSGVVPEGGEWTYSFDLAAADLEVPIAASIVFDGEWACQLEIPGFGCLDGQWSPDLDAELIDPDGDPISLSQCMDGAECGSGRQETLHAMPTVAGTYQIRVYAYLGAPNDGAGGSFGLDLSTGPATAAPPPPPPAPSIHVGDLDRSSVNLSTTRWRARATVRVHSGPHVLVPGAVVRGRFGPNGAVLTCTTGTGGGCTLTRALKKTRASIVFFVVGLSKTSNVYAAGSNHDPDGDSNGTRITVTRP